MIIIYKFHNYNYIIRIIKMNLILIINITITIKINYLVNVHTTGQSTHDIN